MDIFYCYVLLKGKIVNLAVSSFLFVGVSSCNSDADKSINSEQAKNIKLYKNSWLASKLYCPGGTVKNIANLASKSNKLIYRFGEKEGLLEHFTTAHQNFDGSIEPYIDPSLPYDPNNPYNPGGKVIDIVIQRKSKVSIGAERSIQFKIDHTDIKCIDENGKNLKCPSLVTAPYENNKFEFVGKIVKQEENLLRIKGEFNLSLFDCPLPGDAEVEYVNLKVIK